MGVVRAARALAVQRARLRLQLLVLRWRRRRAPLGCRAAGYRPRSPEVVVTIWSDSRRGAFSRSPSRSIRLSWARGTGGRSSSGMRAYGWAWASISSTSSCPVGSSSLSFLRQPTQLIHRSFSRRSPARNACAPSTARPTPIAPCSKHCAFWRRTRCRCTSTTRSTCREKRCAPLTRLLPWLNEICDVYPAHKLRMANMCHTADPVSPLALRPPNYQVKVQFDSLAGLLSSLAPTPTAPAGGPGWKHGGFPRRMDYQAQPLDLMAQRWDRFCARPGGNLQSGAAGPGDPEAACRWAGQIPARRISWQNDRRALFAPRQQRSVFLSAESARTLESIERVRYNELDRNLTDDELRDALPE